MANTKESTELPEVPRSIESGVNRPIFDRHYALFAAAVLGLAAFNLMFRLNREFVGEWDESLYGISAWEAVKNGSWIGTTFLGELDYYNSKPPLLVWFIALSFKMFGASLWSLRLASAVSAWLTIAVVQRWAKGSFGSMVALPASLVLATTFGFIHVHSGRSAATDAPFALVVLLTVVTLSAERERPRRRLWLGPLLAAAFLLRGMAMLMPLLIVAAVLALRGRDQRVSWRASLGAIALFVIPVATWAIARYQVDGWLFFEPLFMYDFVARSVGPIEGHPGGPFYYLGILFRNHYDWLFVGAVALLAMPWGFCELRRLLANWTNRQDRDDIKLLVVWGTTTLVVPTLMQTKLPWYLNTFYPVFAVGIGLCLARSLRAIARMPIRGWRVAPLSAAFVLALSAAEGRLVWYSFHYRDLALSRQSLMLAEREQLRGHRLYLAPHSRAGHFVAGAVVGAQPQRATDVAGFLRDSVEGDYLLTTESCSSKELEFVRSNGRQFLCRRRESVREVPR